MEAVEALARFRGPDKKLIVLWYSGRVPEKSKKPRMVLSNPNYVKFGRTIIAHF